jgi:hypothetical protein
MIGQPRCDPGPRPAAIGMCSDGSATHRRPYPRPQGLCSGPAPCTARALARGRKGACCRWFRARLWTVASHAAWWCRCRGQFVCRICSPLMGVWSGGQTCSPHRKLQVRPAGRAGSYRSDLQAAQEAAGQTCSPHRKLQVRPAGRCRTTWRPAPAGIGRGSEGGNVHVGEASGGTNSGRRRDSR